MKPIQWTTEQRKLADLAEWDRNPAQISKHDAEHLKRSIDKFGLALPLIANVNGDLIDGHQRKRVMVLLDEYAPDTLVDVRVPSRALTEREREELAVRLRRNTGEFDWDVLANEFELDDLKDWGFTDFDLGLTAGDIDWSGAFDLPDGDRAPFQQMTFTLHDSQVEQIKEALDVSKGLGAFETPNENSNGNALARICETFVTDYGQG
jgi:hypothetical protein